MIALLTQAGAEFVAPEVVWSLLWPFIVLALGGILLVTITSVVPALRGGGFPAAWTGATALLAGVLLVPVWNRVNVSVDGTPGSGTEGPRLLVADAVSVDSFTVFVTAIICVSVFFAAMLLDEYLRRENLDGPEWYVLLLMSAAGGVLLASAEDLIVAFLGLEILSISAYVMAALHLRRSESQEAGFKYFLLGALASAIFLYGIALIYGATGSTSLRSIAASTGMGADFNPQSESSLILVGMAMLLVGFAFKVSAVPFHMWTPDVYQGSPTPIVAYMASGVKVAAFAGLVRVFWVGLWPYSADWRPLLAALAVLSLVVGALLALVQKNVKRMLAYSSINHAGFMLLAVHAVATPTRAEILNEDPGFLGAQALLFYMLAYTVMVAGTFGVVTIVGGRGDGHHDLSDYRGLSRRYPLLAALMAVLLFAQAGVPFTSGFFAKFRVIVATTADGSYWLAGVAMLAAVISAVLYLRIVVSMFLVGADDTDAGGAHVVGGGADADTADGGVVDGGVIDGGVVDGGVVDGGVVDGGVVDGVAAAGDVMVETGAGSTAVLTPVRAPAISAVAAVSVAAVVTVVLGVLPFLGDGVLTDAATTLVFFR